MIPYEELVAALARWRARQGLPTGPADYLGEATTVPYDYVAPQADHSQEDVVNLSDDVLEGVVEESGPVNIAVEMVAEDAEPGSPFDVAAAYASGPGAAAGDFYGEPEETVISHEPGDPSQADDQEIDQVLDAELGLSGDTRDEAADPGFAGEPLEGEATDQASLDHIDDLTSDRHKDS